MIHLSVDVAANHKNMTKILEQFKAISVLVSDNEPERLAVSNVDAITIQNETPKCEEIPKYNRGFKIATKKPEALKKVEKMVNLLGLRFKGRWAIAGGFILAMLTDAPYSDIDIFVEGSVSETDFDHDGSVDVSGTIINYTMFGHKCQIIKVDNVNKKICAFDLSCCMVYYHDGKIKSYMNAYQDLLQRVARYNHNPKGKFNGKCLNRVKKYIEKGFKVYLGDKEITLDNLDDMSKSKLLGAFGRYYS